MVSKALIIYIIYNLYDLCFYLVVFLHKADYHFGMGITTQWWWCCWLRMAARSTPYFSEMI